MKGKNPKAAAGFTLIELLVVIAIIMVLGALVFVGVGRATRAAYKTESINNIRGLSAITLAGASDNQGVFPEIHFGDMPFWFKYEWREDAGISRDMVYCSANPCWTKKGIDVCSSSKRDLWDIANRKESSIFSYSCLVNDTGWADNGDFLHPDNFEIIEDRVTGEEEQVRWFLERTNQEVAYPILWMDASMTWNNQRIGNFMQGKRDSDPEGVHVGYLDTSVEWIDGNKMKARYRGGGLVLYW